MGAWGYEPWDNDSALDWLHDLEKVVKRALAPALRPLKEEKFIRYSPRLPKRPKNFGRGSAAWLAWQRRLKQWRKKRLAQVVSLPTLRGSCHHDALAAVQVVLGLPVLQQHAYDWRVSEGETYAEICARVLLNLKANESFISTWREPKQYVAVLDRELRRVRRVVRAQRAARQKLVEARKPRRARRKA